MVNLRITELLSKAKDPDRVFPATDLYNEGWMLRLVIDWFSRNPPVECDIRFLKGSRWYSEALLPSQFLARQRGDKLAESWTHADGVIGHFEIGKNADGDLTLYAVRQDAELYALLALVDPIRIGQPRERNLAIKLLGKHLGVVR
jgi:hypothetical protein